MPYDGSGTYAPAAAPNFPAISGATISSVYYNAVINDLATALSNVITRDGQGKPTANIDWNLKNLTNVAALGAVTLTISGAASLVSATLTGKLVTAASVVGAAGFNLPHGTAPTAPVNGDLWTTTLGLFTQINGVATQYLTSAGVAALTNKTIDLASNTLTGTLAQFNTALSGTDFVSLTGAETLTNKTLTSPSLTGASLDNASTITASGTISALSIGFRGIPQNAQSAVYTLVLDDNGKHVANTTGGWAIPANGSVAFPIGAAVGLYNNSAASQSITITTDTLRQAGTAGTGARTLAGYGLATIVKVGATEWVISGAGVS